MKCLKTFRLNTNQKLLHINFKKKNYHNLFFKRWLVLHLIQLTRTPTRDVGSTGLDIQRILYTAVSSKVYPETADLESNYIAGTSRGKDHSSDQTVCQSFLGILFFSIFYNSKKNRIVSTQLAFFTHVSRGAS